MPRTAIKLAPAVRKPPAGKLARKSAAPKSAARKTTAPVVAQPLPRSRYGVVRGGIVDVVTAAKYASTRHVNALMTAAYWEIGRRIVEAEQSGRRRADYGDELIVNLSDDLTMRFGRGFSRQNLQQMRAFFLMWPMKEICQTVSGELPIRQTPSGKSGKARLAGKNEGSSSHPSARAKGELQRLPTLTTLAQAFVLPWSAYARLLAVKHDAARQFYETEALRGGWSVRQLTRQIESQFYERTALSRNKVAMLEKGGITQGGDLLSVDEAIKDPYVLEFLNLKDEYSESDLEEALIARLETFLLELGSDFAFIGRQRRLRVDHTWYRVDLLLFHRRLRCLVIVDLKLGSLSHADVGQMHLYCNYARANWMLPEENPPVGLILCADKGHALARYSLDGLPSKIMAADYQTVLPDTRLLQEELDKAHRMLDLRRLPAPSKLGANATRRRS